ncbi:MAG TPA: ABC transporter permease [Candidatus Limnocylindria bacterium]|nr:ABC transporter permease [Candidatus Limnocylindria bacterium]
MGRYILRRLIISIPTLLGISLIIFLILALAPGDPMSQFAANPEVPAEVRERVRASLGLDEPIPVRYVKWLWAMLHGDLGFSFSSRTPVLGLILQRLPQTLWVLGTANIVGILIAIPIGVISAVKRYSLFDHVSTTVAFLGFSVPSFFTGLVLILIFAVQLRWLPFIYDSTVVVTDVPSFIAQVRQTIMPVVVIAFFLGATMMRYVRAEMLENIPQDYVRTARAKGLDEGQVVFRHVLRNSLIPVITLVALSIPHIFTGAVITEQIFSVPGIGHLLILSIQNADTPVVMAITFIFALLVVLFNLVADVLYAFADPRVRYG